MTAQSQLCVAKPESPGWLHLPVLRRSEDFYVNSPRLKMPPLFFLETLSGHIVRTNKICLGAGTGFLGPYLWVMWV